MKRVIPKSVIASLLQFVLVLAVIIALDTDTVQAYLDKHGFVKDVFIYFVLIFGFFYLLMSTIKKIKIKRGTATNEIRIPTFKDERYVVLPFMLGVIISGYCIYGLATKQFTDLPMTISVLIIGVFIIFNAIIYVPAGTIRVTKNKLKFINGGFQRGIKLIEFNEITVEKDSIRLSKDGEEIYSLGKMNLKAEHYPILVAFLQNQFKDKVINQAEVLV